MRAVAGNEPTPVLVVIVVGPVEVRVPALAVVVDVREVAVAIRVHPGTNVSCSIHATIR